MDEPGVRYSSRSPTFSSLLHRDDRRSCWRSVTTFCSLRFSLIKIFRCSRTERIARIHRFQTPASTDRSDWWTNAGQRERRDQPIVSLGHRFSLLDFLFPKRQKRFFGISARGKRSILPGENCSIHLPCAVIYSSEDESHRSRRRVVRVGCRRRPHWCPVEIVDYWNYHRTNSNCDRHFGCVVSRSCIADALEISLYLSRRALVSTWRSRRAGERASVDTNPSDRRNRRRSAGSSLFSKDSSSSHSAHSARSLLRWECILERGIRTGRPTIAKHSNRRGFPLKRTSKCFRSKAKVHVTSVNFWSKDSFRMSSCCFRAKLSFSVIFLASSVFSNSVCSRTLTSFATRSSSSTFRTRLLSRMICWSFSKVEKVAFMDDGLWQGRRQSPLLTSLSIKSLQRYSPSREVFSSSMFSLRFSALRSLNCRIRQFFARENGEIWFERERKERFDHLPATSSSAWICLNSSASSVRNWSVISSIS